MLSAGDIANFFEQGYLLVPGLLAPHEVSEVALAFDRLETRAEALRETSSVGTSLFVIGRASDRSTPRLDRVVWCGGVEPTLKTRGRSPKALEIATDLLGADAFDHIINQAHVKRPGDGLAFGWHQDSQHRRCGTDLWRDVNGRGSFAQIIVAIDRMSPENGGLSVIPGSVALGHVPLDETGTLPSSCFDEARAVPIIAEPGTALLLHPYTIHGSGPNRGAGKRRVFINGFSYPGANRRSYPGAGLGERIAADRKTAA